MLLSFAGKMVVIVLTRVCRISNVRADTESAPDPELPEDEDGN